MRPLLLRNKWHHKGLLGLFSVRAGWLEVTRAAFKDCLGVLSWNQWLRITWDSFRQCYMWKLVVCARQTWKYWSFDGFLTSLSFPTSANNIWLTFWYKCYSQKIMTWSWRWIFRIIHGKSSTAEMLIWSTVNSKRPGRNPSSPIQLHERLPKNPKTFTTEFGQVRNASTQPSVDDRHHEQGNRTSYSASTRHKYLSSMSCFWLSRAMLVLRIWYWHRTLKASQFP